MGLQTLDLRQAALRPRMTLQRLECPRLDEFLHRQDRAGLAGSETQKTSIVK